MNRRCSPGALWIGVVMMLTQLYGCSDEPPAAEPDDEPRDVRAPDANAEPGDTTDAGADEAPPISSGPCGAGEFASTFAAIQAVIFEGASCTNAMCHGAATLGGLDLRADVAYQNLIEVGSTSSSLFRVMPGEPDESLLYNKLRAATEPGSIEIAGSPMPSGRAPLRPEQLAAVRRWIEAGAPREGSVGDSVTGRSDGVAKLLGSCLPEATPVEIAPLAAPAADEGIQLVMAPFTLPSATEVDVCFAQYYDLSEIVPAEHQDPEREVFFINGQRVRQDPHSHHLILIHPQLGAESIDHPSLGAWTCRGGEEDAEPCDPRVSSACGAGQCASELQHRAACLGFGPPGGTSAFGQGRVASAQTAQYYRAPREGVYETFPIRGLLYWNSHAFNLTSEDTELNAWVNLYFATDPQYELETLAITNQIGIAAGQPPFTRKTYCAPWVAPEGSRMYTLASHTHKRGRNFTVDLPDGTRIYTSTIYSDPVELMFDPPMLFDSADAAERTLTYCAEFDNGLKDDGSPDLDLVTRLSTMPDRTTCVPVACASGSIGAPCAGESDDASCDTSPGAGDGWCDACPITGGQTTENEMFVLSPSIVTR